LRSELSFLRSTGRLKLVAKPRKLKLLLTLPGGGITLSQATKARKDDSFLSEASELRQDPRRTSHLSQPKHFVLSEASELRQDPRRTSHLSQPKHFMLREASRRS